jgi:hypothetical protein
VTTAADVPRTLVAGAREFSLGAAILQELSAAHPDASVLAVDIEPITSASPNIIKCQVDLNPFQCRDGFEVWSARLYTQIKSFVQLKNPPVPIRSVFLGVGRYQVGKFVDSTAAERADILGCGVMGKLEILHSVMRLNAECGFDSAAGLFVIDVGSLHTLRHTSRRAIYHSAKAAGLELCRDLVSGSEIRRAIHLAPGPLDTPMLHWNHWVLKENGSPRFPDLVRTELPVLYSPIFRGGDRDAFGAAVEELKVDAVEVRAVFERYLHRRRMLSETEEGITAPEALAGYLAPELLLNARSVESGILEITSPQGRLNVVHHAF